MMSLEEMTNRKMLLSRKELLQKMAAISLGGISIPCLAELPKNKQVKSEGNGKLATNNVLDDFPESLVGRDIVNVTLVYPLKQEIEKNNVDRGFGFIVPPASSYFQILRDCTATIDDKPLSKIKDVKGRDVYLLNFNRTTQTAVIKFTVEILNIDKGLNAKKPNGNHIFQISDNDKILGLADDDGALNYKDTKFFNSIRECGLVKRPNEGVSDFVLRIGNFLRENGNTYSKGDVWNPTPIDAINYLIRGKRTGDCKAYTVFVLNILRTNGIYSKDRMLICVGRNNKITLHSDLMYFDPLLGWKIVDFSYAIKNKLSFAVTDGKSSALFSSYSSITFGDDIDYSVRYKNNIYSLGYHPIADLICFSTEPKNENQFDVFPEVSHDYNGSNLRK